MRPLDPSAALGAAQRNHNRKPCWTVQPPVCLSGGETAPPSEKRKLS